MPFGFGKKDKKEKMDMEEVDAIVNRMKNKYRAEGLEFDETPTELSELKGIITGGEGTKLRVQKPEELKESESTIVSRLGSLYLALGGITKPMSKVISKMSFTKRIGFYLYSANMPYSAQQWLALTSIVSLVIAILSFIILFGLFLVQELAIHVPVLLSLLVFLFSMGVMLLIPKRQAQHRGKRISTELPFALRQMSTELRAGIGFYRTMQTIAKADYGELSEEFSRVITEVEEGTDTKDALRHLALRAQSRALRNSIMHMVRALKTGGNLSQIMEEIAEDVSYNLRMEIRDFSQKMNFFGVIFIFLVIIMPVFVGILGGIRNTPMKGGVSFEMIPLTPEIIALIYLVGMPIVLIFLFIYINMMQPKV